MEINYSEMTEEQISLINEYCDNDMKKLKQICFFVWGKKGLPSCYHDDLYDDAIEVLSESAWTFNPDKDTKFKTFLTSNLKRSYKDWYRNTHFRAKRSNLELDENGRIKKDENGNPIIIPNVSFESIKPDKTLLAISIFSIGFQPAFGPTLGLEAYSK